MPSKAVRPTPRPTWTCGRANGEGTLTTGLGGVNVPDDKLSCSGGPGEASGRIPTSKQGGSVLVEIDETAAGPTMRGLGRDRPTVAEQTDKTFEKATATVVPAARSLIARLRARGRSS